MDTAGAEMCPCAKRLDEHRARCGTVAAQFVSYDRDLSGRSAYTGMPAHREAPDFAWANHTGCELRTYLPIRGRRSVSTRWSRRPLATVEVDRTSRSRAVRGIPEMGYGFCTCATGGVVAPPPAVYPNPA